MTGESIQGVSGTQSTWSTMCSDQLISVGGHRNDDAAARLGLLDLGDHFLVQGILWRKAQDRHPLVDQGDGTVLHLAGRIGLCMDVGNLLQLQAHLHRRLAC